MREAGIASAARMLRARGLAKVIGTTPQSMVAGNHGRTNDATSGYSWIDEGAEPRSRVPNADACLSSANHRAVVRTITTARAIGRIGLSRDASASRDPHAERQIIARHGRAFAERVPRLEGILAHQPAKLGAKRHRLSGI